MNQLINKYLQLMDCELLIKRLINIACKTGRRKINSFNFYDKIVLYSTDKKL